MVTDKKIKIGNDDYYFGSDGKMVNKIEIEENTNDSKKTYDSEKTDESQSKETKENNEDASLEDAI